MWFVEGGGLGTEYVFTDALYQISNKSYITLSNSNNKNKSSVFSILMCFYNIRKKSCGVVWDEETMGTMDDKTMMASLKRTPDD